MEARLMIHQIYEYVQGNVNSRCLIEAEKILEAKHLITCGVKDVSSDYFDLFALCLQTSALNNAPHTITGRLRRSNNKLIIENFLCSCKAGPGGCCKHITAVLIYCNRNPITSLDKISATDQECLWKKKKDSSLQNYKPVPMQDYCHITPNPNSTDITEEILSSFKEAAMRVCPNSVLSLHKVGQMKDDVDEEMMPFDIQLSDDWLRVILIRSLDIQLPEVTISDLHKEFYEKHVKIDSCGAIKLAKETVGQNDELWLQERKYRLTGSTCYSMYTYARNKNPDWDKKVLNTLLCSCFCGNSATRHGKMYEDIAIEEYTKCTSKTVQRTGILINSEIPFLGFSPDGLSFDNDGLTLIEVKCPIAGKFSSAVDVVQTLKYLNIQDGQFHLKKKHSYFGQVQLGMFLTGASKCHMIIFCPFDKSFVNIIIEYDLSFIHSFLLTLNSVYFEHILPTICKFVMGENEECS